MGYGVVAGLLSDENKGVQPRQAISRPVRKTIIIVVSVLVVVVYLGAKRMLGVKPGPRNQDLFEILRLPFIRLPQEVRVAIRGMPNELTPAETEELVQRVVWPRISEDVFVCRKCGRRQSDFVATMDGNSRLAEVACAQCALAESAV